MRRSSGVATIVAALWLAASPDLPAPRNGAGDARLDTLTAALPFVPAEVAFSKPARGAGHDIPLCGDRKHLIVDGTLNGIVTGPMLVDTGASYCVLTRGTARKLGLGGRPRRTIPVATANGQIDAPFVELEALQLQEARLDGVNAVVMDAVEPPLIGIIGLNFLTQFRFSVDLAAGQMRLEP